MQEIQRNTVVMKDDSIPSPPIITGEELEGLDKESGSWGDYPLDDLLIRQETRTIYEVVRRIDQSTYIMDPDFQRVFLWSKEKQSKLIESVVMRVPLPVFYLAEDPKGKMIIVDGLQRLSTFHRFVKDELQLYLPDRNELHGRRFSDLSPKIQNRVEDCNLILYIIDSKAPERARLDIFERVNSGVPLTRQQMRNCLFMGKSTQFLKKETQTDIFLQATGYSLNEKTMRDREFLNRFCAFQILGVDEYRGDMDEFLANCLTEMNQLDESDLHKLSDELCRGLSNNLLLFGEHSFRKSLLHKSSRSVLNASLWDVMSTGLSHYDEQVVKARTGSLHDAACQLLNNEDFKTAITISTNDSKKVRTRFSMVQERLREIFGDHAD